MKYKIKKKGKDNPYWVVVDNTGRIANNFKHPSLDNAENHRKWLEALFGDNCR